MAELAAVRQRPSGGELGLGGEEEGMVVGGQGSLVLLLLSLVPLLLSLVLLVLLLLFFLSLPALPPLFSPSTLLQKLVTCVFFLCSFFFFGIVNVVIP